MLLLMKRTATTLLFLLFLATVTAFAADVTGAWTAKVMGRGGQEQDYTFNFKQAGDALTGSITTPMGDSPISEGKVTGDNISFVQALDRGGNVFKINYKGTVAGAVIKFTREVEGRGNPTSFEAKKK